MEVIATSLETSGKDEGQLGLSLSYFGITEEGRRDVSELSEMSTEVAGEIIESFYDHILSHPESRAHFTDEEQIARVKKGQTKYFSELISAQVDVEYVGNRRKIGRIHERARVTPTLYIGSYSFYLSRLSEIMRDKMAEDPKRTFEIFSSLMKLALFDMSLALETYVETREETISARERELSELPTPVLKLREGLLLVPVVGTLDSYRARMLTVKMLEEIRSKRARSIVLDITGVSSVDSAVANHLIQAMNAARLMGASSILTGMSADVAQSLVKVGVTAEALNTAGDLQQGIELAERLL